MSILRRSRLSDFDRAVRETYAAQALPGYRAKLPLDHTETSGSDWIDMNRPDGDTPVRIEDQGWGP